MSNIVVHVKRIDRVAAHPNADRLDLAVVGGWQCVVPKGKFGAGDLITYIPPDSILPDALAESLGVTKYLSKGRVRANKLRGEPSFGLVIEPHGEEGENVAAKLGITKYQPPMKFHAGDAEPSDPLFVEYTDIENLRHYPEILTEGERVIGTEKIHGTNCRVGMVRNEDGTWKKLAGSRTMQRKDTPGSVYHFPWTVQAVADMIEWFGAKPGTMQVIVFGEVYGKVQAMRYGLPNAIGFRCFDIMVDGHFLSHELLAARCGAFKVEVCPVIYDGPYSLAAIAQASKGQSLIPGADHIREGVVVRPIAERRHEKTGRVILKYVSDDYLCGEYDGASE